MKKWFVVFTLLALPGLASAVDRKRYICDYCMISNAAGVTDIGQLTEVVSFLKSQINPAVDRWIPHDTVTICDGVGCLKLEYLANGNFIPRGVYKDRHGKYENAGATIPDVTLYADAAPDYYSAQIVGHYEWWDFYSNGTYTGSSQSEWIYDGMSVQASAHYRMYVHYAIP